MEWEKAEIETKTLYKAFSPKEINAHIAMKIGLRGVNVTMKGSSITYHPKSYTEIFFLRYSEHFNCIFLVRFTSKAAR
jgi:hypothetical protein